MKKYSIRGYVLLLLFCGVLILSACQSVDAAPALDVTWRVAVPHFEIKNSLDAVESVTQYNGSKIDVVHSQSPEPGNVYLVMELGINKVNNQSTASFNWQNLVVMDESGNSYPRLESDSFLEQYQYTPRITGLELRFGENSGWVCYEIPASVASGKLTLAYTAEESQQKIVLQK